jgi:polyhydroxybutyrate depolymerase
MPLVVLLHGYGSTGARQEAYMKVVSLADKEKFVLVVPDGTENSRRERFWNAGPICCDFFNSRVNDEQFLVDLVKYVSARNNVDSRRVYFIGHSNGGAMAYRIACHHRELVAAMASLAGVGQDEMPACGGSDSVGVLHIHGTSDEEVNYLGGLRFGKPYVSAVELSSRWAELNQCEARNQKLPQKIDLVRNLPGDETEISAWASCGRGVKNELWTIERGNHVPALSVDFIDKVYAFLSAHSR